jgi:hypothetical protein
MYLGNLYLRLQCPVGIIQVWLGEQTAVILPWPWYPSVHCTSVVPPVAIAVSIDWLFGITCDVEHTTTDISAKFKLTWYYEWVQSNENSDEVMSHVKLISGAGSTGTTYPSGAYEFTPGFYWGSCYSIFSFMCMFCRSLFDLLSFFLWPLCCLFFDLRILITPFVSSNSS